MTKFENDALTALLSMKLKELEQQKGKYKIYQAVEKAYSYIIALEALEG